MEQQHQYDQMSTHRAQIVRDDDMRRTLREFFLGGPNAWSGTSQRKTPALPVPQGCPSMRISPNHLSRAATMPATMPTSISIPSPRYPSSLYSPITSQPITPHSLQDLRRTMSLPQSVTQIPGRLFVGVDPEERYLAELAAQGRRRRSKRTRHRNKKNRRGLSWTNKRIRSRIITCFLSILLLTIVLSTYLALTLSNRQESQEFHVFLILIILVSTIFFCHSLISLCLLVVRPSEQDGRPRMSVIETGTGGFANPPYPIRVALIRDEEAAGIESEVTKYPPPAYGLWRESVRVDPNRIFWQRNEEAISSAYQNPVDRESESVPSSPRPPSYVSDDGVSYVIEAGTRSLASLTDCPRPTRHFES